MDKNRIILIAIVILVIVLAAVVLVFNNQHPDVKAVNNTTAAEMNNTTNIIVEQKNATNATVANLSGNTSNVKNVSLEDNGWKWSQKEQCYIHQFIDADGDLHVQTANVDGITDIEFKADGTVYTNGKDVTERYYRDFK